MCVFCRGHMILMGAVVVACAAVLGISAACCRVPKTQVHTHYSLSSACVMPHVYVLLLSVVGKRGGGGQDALCLQTSWSHLLAACLQEALIAIKTDTVVHSIYRAMIVLTQ